MRTDVVAVMFTDLVGYTERTSSQSHSENAEMLKRVGDVVPPLVRSFGGRVVKEMGDGMLSVFDAPTGAVEAAMAIQDRLAEINHDLDEDERMRLRVAVNVGEVRFDRGDVFGEAVNIAARIESQTPAEQIYVSESTVLTMNRANIPLEYVGPLELKGINHAVTVYEVPAQPVTENVERTGRDKADTLPYLGLQLAELRSHLRRRRLKLASVVLAASALLSVVGQQAWQRHREGAEVEAMQTALREHRFVEAASRLAVLREKGMEVEADLEKLISALREQEDPASACLAADRLVFLSTHRDALVRLRLTHAFDLIKAGELAQARTCLAGVNVDEREAEARVLELNHIHLEALEAQAHHRAADLKAALKKYEQFLRAGDAPAGHHALIARIAADGYLSKVTRPVSDSLVVESLGGDAVAALMERVTDLETPGLARAWLMARLADIDDGHLVDWRSLFAAVLHPRSGSTCSMRRDAIDGLRRMQALRDVGLIARELARNDRCTRTHARTAMQELVAEGAVEMPETDALVVVATR